MAKKKKGVVDASAWPLAELVAVRKSGIGPGIIGQEMYDAAMSLPAEAVDGGLGPAILATSPEEAEAMGARHLVPVASPEDAGAGESDEPIEE